jgi:hypothetical protein
MLLLAVLALCSNNLHAFVVVPGSVRAGSTFARVALEPAPTTVLTMTEEAKEATPQTFREAEILGLKCMQQGDYQGALESECDILCCICICIYNREKESIMCGIQTPIRSMIVHYLNEIQEAMCVFFLFSLCFSLYVCFVVSTYLLFICLSLCTYLLLNNLHTHHHSHFLLSFHISLPKSPQITRQQIGCRSHQITLFFPRRWQYRRIRKYPTTQTG